MDANREMQREFDPIARLLPIVGYSVARFSKHAWTPSSAGPLASRLGYLKRVTEYMSEYDAILIYKHCSVPSSSFLVGVRSPEGKKEYHALAGFGSWDAEKIVASAKQISMWRHASTTDGSVAPIISLLVVGALSFFGSIRALVSPESAPMNFGELIGISIVCVAAFFWVRVEIKQNHRKFRASLPAIK